MATYFHISLFLLGCLLATSSAQCTLSGTFAINSQWTANGNSYTQYALTIYNSGGSNVPSSGVVVTLSNLVGYDTDSGTTYGMSLEGSVSGNTGSFALNSGSTLYASQNFNGQGVTVTSTQVPTFASASCGGSSGVSASSSTSGCSSGLCTTSTTGSGSISGSSTTTTGSGTSTTGWNPPSSCPGLTCASGSTVEDCTCCPNYCSSVDNSDSCDSCGGIGASGCTRVNNAYCRPASWTPASEESWFVSRSTHYGSTIAGACGFTVAPNCSTSTSNPECPDIPSDLTSGSMVGMYAAPQGDYYAQNGGYLSCGECFQIQCRDSSCYSQTATVTVQVVDACPCEGNSKWCCDVQSHCGELGPATDGAAHCAVSGGQWSAESIHLDLSDVAFNKLTTGNQDTTGPHGIVNTVARRVSCTGNVVGNVYIRLHQTAAPQNCGDGTCYYYFPFVVMNAAGLGGIASVQLYAKTSGSGTASWFNVPRNNDNPAEPQMAYGEWLVPSGTNVYPPFQFKFTDMNGQTITSNVFSSFAACNTDICYYNSGVQFS